MATQKNDPETTSDDHAADTQSDPAQDDGTTSDWSSEGGAVPEGPATHTEDG